MSIKLNLRILLCLSFSLCVNLAFGQSGRRVETPPETPVQELKSDKEKPKTEIPKPESNYEIIGPKTISSFLEDLKTAGKRGFRLEKFTVLPTGSGNNFNEKVESTVLAGIVKFDGKNGFDYSYLSTESEIDPASKLNNLGQNGWYFRDVVSIFGEPVVEGGMVGTSVLQFPTLGNIYLLERVIDSELRAPNYQLIKAGATLGKNPKGKIEESFIEALKNGYKPVASYYTYVAKSVFSVDSSYNILLVKGLPSPDLEYKFVLSGRSDGLRKDIIKLSAQGYRIASINFNTAILVRKAEKTAPVSYQWIETSKKDYQTILNNTLSKSPVYRTGGIDQIGSGDYLKSLLVFEDNSTAETNLYEYQTVKMSPIIPKEFKKTPQVYLSKFEKPEIAFQKLLDQGYIPRDIFYSTIDGLTVLFEREKKY